MCVANIWSSEYEKADKKTIESVESKLSIVFPKDYVTFVISHQGGQPSKNRINIDNKTITLDYLLTFLAFDELDILDKWNALKRLLPNKVIPFALSSGDNVVCFDFRKNDNSPKVVYCDIEMAKRKCECYIYDIADSFGELLSKLS